MSYQNRASSLVSDYANMRSLPAMLSVVFIIASAYQFGAISQLTFNWVSYTISTSHMVLLSLGAYAAAFASSETRRFESYDQWEQVAIATGPLVIIGYEYVPQVTDFVTSLGDPLGMQLAFLATVISWGVATQ